MASVPESLLRNWTLSDFNDEVTKVDRRSTSFVEAKSHTINKLRHQLQIAQQELQLKGKEKERLERVRDQMECEVDELTANLFEDANKMVIEANVKRMDTEKELQHSLEQITKLQTDLSAMKTLLASFDEQRKQMEKAGASPQQGGKSGSLPRKLSLAPSPSIKKKFSFNRRFSRSKSQTHLMDAASPSTETSPSLPQQPKPNKPELLDNIEGLEEFKQWKLSPLMNDSSPFIKRILDEDIRPCLSFQNVELSASLVESTLSNTIEIEPLSSPDRESLCELSGYEVLGSHQIKLPQCEKQVTVCHSIRNKIISVCELISYLSYVNLGIVKGSNDRELFDQIQILRRSIVMRRLGYAMEV